MSTTKHAKTHQISMYHRRIPGVKNIENRLFQTHAICAPLLKSVPSNESLWPFSTYSVRLCRHWKPAIPLWPMRFQLLIGGFLRFCILWWYHDFSIKNNGWSCEVIILFMSVCWKQACLCLVMLSRSESSRMSRSCFMVLKIFICIGCWCLCILRMNKLMLSSSQQGRISRESIVDSQKHILASLRCTLSYQLLVRAQEACISSDRMGKSRTCSQENGRLYGYIVLHPPPNLIT